MDDYRNRNRKPYELTQYDEIADRESKMARGCGCYLLYVAFIILCVFAGNWFWGLV